MDGDVCSSWLSHLFLQNKDRCSSAVRLCDFSCSKCQSWIGTDLPMLFQTFLSKFILSRTCPNMYSTMSKHVEEIAEQHMLFQASWRCLNRSSAQLIHLSQHSPQEGRKSVFCAEKKYIVAVIFAKFRGTHFLLAQHSQVLCN